jgi:thiamine biosynthesis lipoprotein
MLGVELSARQTRLLMGMPITVEIVDSQATQVDVNAVFTYFEYIDQTFSTYKAESEISRINRGELQTEQASEDVRTVFLLSEETRRATDGYFNIYQNGYCDPSGLVKGWAIYNAAEMLRARGFRNYYVDAGGNIQAVGKNSEGLPWRVGIQNPWNLEQIVKVLSVTECGVATSGTYVRGQHIYNPRNGYTKAEAIISLTVIGPNIYEADRFATAAFAMEHEGIAFIETLEGFEGYMIDHNGRATLTSGFKRYEA